MLQSLEPIANFTVFDYVPMCQIVHGWKYHVNELIHQQVRAYKDLAKIILSMLYKMLNLKMLCYSYSLVLT